MDDSVLAPGWTSYHDYTEFDVHDVTAALASPGPHVLGLRLADGWFAGRIGALGESAQYGRVLRAWWQLSLTYADGSTAVVGPDSPIVLPHWSHEVHYEAELAVVIKSVAKDLAPRDVPRVVLGYTVANDVSARDRQRGDDTWTRAKAFDTSCPLGPWIEVPGPEIGFDPDDAVVRVRVDGDLVQEGATSDMIRSVAELVSYASGIFTLLPGDVVLTGTPTGTGEIRAGQRVEVEVEGIGSFSNPVVRR